MYKDQKLIYSGFPDSIFSIGDEFSTPKQAALRNEIPDFGIREMFDKIPRDIETEESAEQRRKTKRQGLRILTPEQMLSRNSRNNSEKLKNEIRQLLYSWYRPNKISKTICNNLVNAI